jgi:homoserine kinase type II
VGAYALGELLRLEPIPAGSVNSNFAVELGGGRFFLRLYEEQGRAGAQAEARMLVRLAAGGVPTPAPIARRDGGLVSEAGGKPAALFPWRAGGMRCQAGVTEADASRVGGALARMHVVGVELERAPGRFEAADLARRLDAIAASGDARFAPLVPGLRAELDAWAARRDPSLPGGLVHGDLFRDNVLWSGDGAVAALLDFESASDGVLAYDLAVTLLAWCFGDAFDPALGRAMIAGYASVRPLGPAERRGLRAECAFAALRFTITRITDYAMRVTAGPRVVKDWRRFRARLDTFAAMTDGEVAALCPSPGLPPAPGESGEARGA